MKTIKLFFGTTLFFSQLTFSQNINVGDMQISWEHQKDILRFTALAPDDGWVALGFNDNNDIVGCHLIMISVNGNTLNDEEFYVVSAGNPEPMTKVGSSRQVSNVQGYEKNGWTKIQFSIQTKALDEKHFNLKKGNKIWLIAAFSMEDEFEHHSRFRRHVEITL